MYERIRGFFEGTLRPLDRLCNYLFGSKYNPLYQSGAIAIALLAVMIVTGVYLLFMYRVAAPYESLRAIDGQIYLGRWIRALHRYASDAAIVAVVAHIWRMIAEGKTWGPRFLAWTTGVFLGLMMLVIGWTGFVLVWDFHGQSMAVAGARMIDTVPLFRGSILRAFSGAAYIGQSFFFMNLFLHMSLPLGMIFGLWLHTMRLKHATWLPAKPLLFGLIGALTALAIVRPAPLASATDLLKIGGEYPLNIFYGFFIPLARSTSPGLVLLGALTGLLALLTAPFWLKPAEADQPVKSTHNAAACTGCSQCYQDCPFEAIEMVPRTIGQGSDSVAAVIEDYCVGCGICSASCTQMAIGPQDKSAKGQLRAIKNLHDRRRDEGRETGGILLVHCGNNEGDLDFLERVGSLEHLTRLSVDCTGIVHPGAIKFALRFFRGVFVFSCAPRACKNRLGPGLTTDRALHERSPGGPGEWDPVRVRVASGSRSDFDQVLEELFAFSNSLGFSPRASVTGGAVRVGSYLRLFSATACGLCLLALGSALPYSDRAPQAHLRLAARIPVQMNLSCRQLTAEQIANLPAHMRKAEDCTRSPIPYAYELFIDGKSIAKNEVDIAGVRGDKPMIIEEEYALSPGEHAITLTLAPRPPADARTFELGFSAAFGKNEAELIYYDADTKTLRHRGNHR